MLDATLRRLIDPPLHRLGAAVAATGITAMAVTWVGFGVGLMAIAAIALEHYSVGLGLFLINRCFDGLDGAVARARRPDATTSESDVGAYLDIVLDFLIYAGMVLGFALADPANALAAAFLLFCYIGTASSFLGFAIFAAKRNLTTELRGRKRFYYLGGAAEGTETILATVLMALLPHHFSAIAVGFGALCLVTVFARLAFAFQTLR